MKKCVRYLRYSSTGQSKCSIELQDMNTLSWCTYNNTEVLETFEDKGKSATNFDRPNFKELELFIKKWHKTVDYVLVNSFDRFSRDAGEAMMKIKYYCTKYNIRIASAGENCIYDPEDVSSFWNVALAFIRAEDEIMRHKKRVNGGIYASKKEERRYIAAKAPYGYKKISVDKKTNIAISDKEAEIVGKLIDSFYHNNTSLPVLRKMAIQFGVRIVNKHSIKRMLTNPVYYGMQILKPYGNMPGGIIDGKWDSIRPADWYYTITNRLNDRSKKQRFKLNEAFPLRGIVKCAADCNKNFTAGFSRGKYNLYGYYFCTTHRKENYPAVKMHVQMEQIMELLNIPDNYVSYLQKEALKELTKLIAARTEKIQEAKKQLSTCMNNIENLEDQFLLHKTINAETFNRQSSRLSQERVQLNHIIEAGGNNYKEIINLFTSELPRLATLSYIYNNISISDKQQLLNLVFEGGLYYTKNTYRTPSILYIFAHNYLTIRQKNLLIIDDLEQKHTGSMSGAPSSPTFEHLTLFLKFIHNLKVA